MYCLWCDGEIVPDLSWSNVLRFRPDQIICSTCKQQFSVIQGERCPACSRPMARGQRCRDCQQWQGKGSKLDGNYSIFSYNPFIQAIIAKWKYRGDYVLVELFREAFQHHYLQIPQPQKPPVLVPIPLSQERFQERGFNQALALAQLLDAPIAEPLTRTHSEKQSKKSKEERMSAPNPFQVTYPIEQPVVLIDDIYTTGRTLQYAAARLKEQGVPWVYAYTLIHG